jgi:8-oxo-dGTP pyrophosphatase MutT (NUDIX family)
MAKLEPRVGCIIFTKSNKGTEVLLINSNYSKRHEFPRGGINKGEDIYQALKREVFEETGIPIIPDKPIKAYEYEEWHMTRHGIKLHYDVILFTCVINKVRLKPIDTNEVKDVNWYPIDVAMKILIQEKSMKLLEALIHAYIKLVRKGML